MNNKLLQNEQNSTLYYIPSLDSGLISQTLLLEISTRLNFTLETNMTHSTHFTLGPPFQVTHDVLHCISLILVGRSYTMHLVSHAPTYLQIINNHHGLVQKGRSTFKRRLIETTVFLTFDDR